MNDTAKETLRKNLYRPANRMVTTVRDNPYRSLAALATIATLGLGAAYLRTNGNRPLAAARQNPSLLTRTTGSAGGYFEAAPRSIYGSHRLQLPATTSSRSMVTRGGSLIFGSAVLLTSLYLLGRKM